MNAPAGDSTAPDALIQAYLDHRSTLVRIFAAKLRSVEAAEDLVQELYIRVQRAPYDEPIADPRAWLFRAGMNLLVDGQRGAQRGAARDTAWARDHQGVADEPVQDEPSPERVVADRQVLARALAVVDTMPPRMAEAFRLNRPQGLSQPQVADRMGVSLKAVEKHLAGALQRLVIELKGVWP